MSKIETRPIDPATPKTLAEAARTSPTAVFEAPDDVVEADHLTKKEKVEVLDQWEADAKSLQTATDEGMSGGKRPRLDEVKAAQTELDEKASVAGEMADLEKPTLSSNTPQQNSRR